MPRFRSLILLALIPALASAAEPPQPAPLAAEARGAAHALADMLERDYTIPATGRAYARALRSAADRGTYDLIGDRKAIAQAITADVQAVAVDGHVRVSERGGASGRAAVPRPALAPVADARWIAPGVAYIRFNLFTADPETLATIRTFMAEHEAARSVIFDMRTNHGGGIEAMEAILPYLYARPTPLVTLETRKAVEEREGAMFEDSATVKRIAAPDDLIRRQHMAIPPAKPSPLSRARLFVLTSPTTASAAEHFALALKTTHRATLIGSNTAGANHFGSFRELGEHFRVFVPVGRTFDPATGRDWEGVGVAPDLRVAPEEALTRALELSGVQVAEAQRLGAAMPG